MIDWSNRRTLIAGTALIVAANAIALAGVAYNRSDGPESTLRLTQRELQLPYGWTRRENSGVALSLRWRVANRETDGAGFDYPGGSPDWLDAAKMAGLGFDVAPVAADGHRHEDKQLAREVLLVLELAGPAHARAIERARAHLAREEALAAANADKKEFAARAKSAQDRLAGEERENSRLFVVDAGVELATLRAQYPDRSRYAIVRGQVRPRLDDAGNGNPGRVVGVVSGIGIDEINVPLALRHGFDDSLRASRRSPADRPHAVEVAFGKRFEPWITAVKAGAEQEETRRAQ